MRLRPLFPRQFNNNSKNKSRSLHNCPSCRCQSPSQRLYLKDSKNSDQNIYTNLRNSSRDSRLRRQKRYLQVSQLNKSRSSQKDSKIAITEKVVKQKCQESLDQTAYFKNIKLTSQQFKRIPNTTFQNISTFQNHQKLNFQNNLYNHKHNKQNISIRYISPQLIRSKSQNNVKFFPINFQKQGSLLIRQPNHNFQFVSYEEPKVTSTPIYFKNIEQKQKINQNLEIKSLYYKFSEYPSKDQQNTNSFQDTTLLNLNLSDSLSYSYQPSQPKVLLQKKNKQFKRNQVQQSQESNDSNNSYGMFQKPLKFEGSLMTGVGSGQGSKYSSNNNLILESKQDLLNPITLKRSSQKKLTMNRHVKGRTNPNIKTNNNIYTQNQNKNQNLIYDKNNISIKAINVDYNNSYSNNIINLKQSQNKDLSIKKINTGQQQKVIIKQVSEITQKEKQFIEVKEKSERDLKISSTQHQSPQNLKSDKNFLQNQNFSSKNNSINIIKKSSNTLTVNQNIKRKLPYTQTSQSIQIEYSSKSVPIQNISQKKIKKSSQSSSNSNNEQPKYITTLERIVSGKNHEQNDSNYDKNSSQNDHNNNKGRFASFKKKRKQYLQQLESYTQLKQTQNQQNNYALKQRMSRSKSNQNKQRKKQRSRTKQQSKTLIQHGRQSKRLANQLMKQLKLYYQYYDEKHQNDQLIN